MGILEKKRILKKNVIGDRVSDIRSSANEKIGILKVKKDVNNNIFDFDYHTIKNEIKKQNAKDELANKKCSMIMRESQNASKIRLLKKDTNNKPNTIVSAFFGIMSAILSMGGLVLSSNGSIYSIFFGIVMLVGILSNNLYIQDKLFDMFRLETKFYNIIKIICFSTIVSFLIVTSVLTNKISIDYLLKDFTFNNETKTIMSIAFSGLFDIVPIIVNSSKLDFNLGRYNKKFSALFEDNAFTIMNNENNEPSEITTFIDDSKVENDSYIFDEYESDYIDDFEEVEPAKEEVKEDKKEVAKRKSNSIYNTQRKFDNAVKKYCENGDVLTPSKIGTKYNGTYQKLRNESDLVEYVDGKYIVNY